MTTHLDREPPATPCGPRRPTLAARGWGGGREKGSSTSITLRRFAGPEAPCLTRRKASPGGGPLYYRQFTERDRLGRPVWLDADEAASEHENRRDAVATRILVSFFARPSTSRLPRPKGGPAALLGAPTHGRGVRRKKGPARRASDTRPSAKFLQETAGSGCFRRPWSICRYGFSAWLPLRSRAFPAFNLLRRPPQVRGPPVASQPSAPSLNIQRCPSAFVPALPGPSPALPFSVSSFLPSPPTPRRPPG